MDLDSQAPSLAVVRAEIDVVISEQERRGSDADSRAGLIVAFAGVIIGLGRDVHNVAQVVALLVAGMSAGAAVVALWPWIGGTVDVERLRDDFLDADQATTVRALVDTHVGLVQRNVGDCGPRSGG